MQAKGQYGGEKKGKDNVKGNAVRRVHETERTDDKEIVYEIERIRVKTYLGSDAIYAFKIVFLKREDDAVRKYQSEQTAQEVTLCGNGNDVRCAPSKQFKQKQRDDACQKE